MGEEGTGGVEHCREWVLWKSRDEGRGRGKQCEGSSAGRVRGSDREGDKVPTGPDGESCVIQIPLRSRGGNSSLGWSHRARAANGQDTLFLTVSTPYNPFHGPASAHHPPPLPRRSLNAFPFLLFLQSRILHPCLLWLSLLMAP